MIPEEQIKGIKEQLISQLEASNLPNKQEIKASIQNMNPKQLEEFLVKNNLIKQSQESSQDTSCVFCSIVSEQTNSYKLDENKEAIAVLEINPVSKGHSLIIPKKHVSSSEKLSNMVFSLAKKISRKLKTKLKAKKIEISNSNLFGHEIINVTPVYNDETINSKRYHASQKELSEIQNFLKSKPRTKRIKIKKQQLLKTEERLWLPKRIP